MGLMVSDNFWNTMNYDQKTAFAETMSCAIAGVGKGVPLEFQSNMTGKQIGKWSMWGLTVY
jgi:hypothetical protein